MIRSEQRYVAPTLSHSSNGGFDTGRRSSCKRRVSHTSSAVAVATARYSAPVEDVLQCVVCVITKRWGYFQEK